MVFRWMEGAGPGMFVLIWRLQRTGQCSSGCRVIAGLPGGKLSKPDSGSGCRVAWVGLRHSAK